MFDTGWRPYEDGHQQFYSVRLRIINDINQPAIAQFNGCCQLSVHLLDCWMRSKGWQSLNKLSGLIDALHKAALPASVVT